MKNTFLIFLAFILVSSSFAQRVENFKLKDAVSGNEFSLESHGEARAVVLIFTSLNCPFSKLYEERIVNLNTQFGSEGFVFALINPHIGIEEEETSAGMKARALEKKIAFPFLEDGDQKVTQQFGITKLPEVVVITPGPTGFAVAYRGAIDNNPQMAQNANLRYLESALTAIQNRRSPSPASSRAVGCNVKLN
ncbi:redoxin domain-containing protein [Aquiflexum gelatinilyticum]|uniref:redoxin domain-containing protein n=1 Tax=Aquiflexum gelatinilyticum TaxID=2961943 RepID=UPI0021673F0C|nr:redoxin domain-containing protein [Aquiflexum gelatinilyticum]MCS4433494.1 redoxin domain-containing protein [Aquiflexum gelatinilyticum]